VPLKTTCGLKKHIPHLQNKNHIGAKKTKKCGKKLELRQDLGLGYCVLGFLGCFHFLGLAIGSCGRDHPKPKKFCRGQIACNSLRSVG